MSNHTPGPWYYKDRMVASESDPAGRTLAYVYDNDDNGKLIEAAPDLLEAAKQALADLATDGCRQFMSRYYTTRAWQSRVNQLRYAIDKAGG